MDTNGVDQLNYYLSSLDELGEILIDAEKINKVGTGVLRLTLGTIMSSKGVIFLINNKKDISVLATQGIPKKNSYTFLNKYLPDLKKYK